MWETARPKIVGTNIKPGQEVHYVEKPGTSRLILQETWGKLEQFGDNQENFGKTDTNPGKLGEALEKDWFNSNLERVEECWL